MNLHIPKPCSENWEAMNPSEKGRMCDVCQKQVFDFTNSTLKDIEGQFLLNNKNLCGRISSKLLTEQYVQQQYKKEYRSKLKLFLIATIICFGINLFTIEKANASILTKLKNRFLSEQTDTTQYQTIKGIVRDKETGEVLPFVSITFLDRDSVIVGTNTNINGEYILKVKKQNYIKPRLKFLYVGYNSVLITDFKFDNKELNINIEAMEAIFLGQMIEIVQPNPLPNPFQSGKTISGDEYRKMPK